MNMKICGSPWKLAYFGFTSQLATVLAAYDYSKSFNTSTCIASTSTTTVIDYKWISTKSSSPITVTVYKDDLPKPTSSSPSVIYNWLSATNSVPDRTSRSSGACLVSVVTTTIPVIVVGDNAPMVIVTVLYGDLKTPPTVPYVEVAVTSSDRQLSAPMIAPTPMRRPGVEPSLVPGQAPDPVLQLYGAGTLPSPPIFEDTQTAPAAIHTGGALAGAFPVQSQVVPEGQYTVALAGASAGPSEIITEPYIPSSRSLLGAQASEKIFNTGGISKSSSNEPPRNSGGTGQLASSASRWRRNIVGGRILAPILAIAVWL